MNIASSAPGARFPQSASLLDWLPVFLGLLALFVPTFYGFATGIWNAEEHSHGPIILATVLWLIWDRREVLMKRPEHTAPRTGFVLLVFGLATYIAGRAVGITIFEIGAIIPILAGTLLAMRGWPAVKTYWFMLLFATYLIPLPSTFVDAVTGPLKAHVSVIAEQILYGVGYPIARTGVVLTIGPYQLLVADACSGINSMFSLSAVGLLYLYLMRHKSYLHNGIIIACLLPIAFAINIARVLFLVLITYHFGDAAGQGFLHGFSGMVLFVVALALIFLLDAGLARIFKSKNSA